MSNNVAREVIFATRNAAVRAILALFITASDNVWSFLWNGADLRSSISVHFRNRKLEKPLHLVDKITMTEEEILKIKLFINFKKNQKVYYYPYIPYWKNLYKIIDNSTTGE